MNVLDTLTLTVLDAPDPDGPESHEAGRRFVEWRDRALGTERGAGVEAGLSAR